MEKDLKMLPGRKVSKWAGNVFILLCGKQKLTDLLKTDAEVIELKKRGKIWYDMTAIVQRTPINRLFIEKIIEKI